MKRALAVLIVRLFLLAACAAPAATPAQPAPATRAPLATVQPEFKRPQSGGVLNPPTVVPTPRNNPAGAIVRQILWQQDVSTNTLPARYDHAFAFMFEVYTMITFGGHAQSTLGDTWITEGRGWTQLSPTTKPPARFGAEAVYYGFGIGPLIFGGQSDKQFFNDVWKYWSPVNGWEKITATGNAPAPRAGASVGVGFNDTRDDSRYIDKLIVTHGYSDKGYFDDTFMLNLSTNTWEDISPANRPSKRKGQAGTFDARQGKFFLFGGQDVAGKLLGDFWGLDPAKRIWTKITPSGVQPTPRSGASLTYDHHGRLWLFGGETGNGLTNEMWMYDITSNQWSLIDSSNKPPARSRHKTACAYDSSCFVFGGMDANGKALNDLWRFTP
jgi:N-acetylneuraminic acid mutarotase